MKFYSLDFYDDDENKTVIARGIKENILKAWELNKKDYMDWLKVKMGLDQEEFRESMGLDHELTEEEIKENLFTGKDKDKPWTRLKLSEIEKEDILKYKITLLSDNIPQVEILVMGNEKDLLGYWRTNKENLTRWFLEYVQDNLPEGKKDPEVEAYELAQRENPENIKELRQIFQKIDHGYWTLYAEKIEEGEFHVLEGEGEPYVLFIPENFEEPLKILEKEDIDIIKEDIDTSDFSPNALLGEIVFHGVQHYEWKEFSRIFLSSFLKDKCLSKYAE